MADIVRPQFILLRVGPVGLIFVDVSQNKQSIKYNALSFIQSGELRHCPIPSKLYHIQHYVNLNPGHAER